jgi:hypothetical protein
LLSPQHVVNAARAGVAHCSGNMIAAA